MVVRRSKLVSGSMPASHDQRLNAAEANRPAASGLLGFDDRAADRARLGKARFERVCFAPADRALQGGQILGEALHDFEHRLARSEEHMSELQSHVNLVCRLLLEKKKKKKRT